MMMLLGTMEQLPTFRKWIKPSRPHQKTMGEDRYRPRETIGKKTEPVSDTAPESGEDPQIFGLLITTSHSLCRQHTVVYAACYRTKGFSPSQSQKFSKIYAEEKKKPITIGSGKGTNTVKARG
jgi:hypothetical protein